jgi:hypothetical protein
MAELRDALLDPEGYSASAPEVGIPDDLSGIARAAAPMARAEMDQNLSQIGYGSGSSLSGKKPSGVPSTFREGRGELIDNLIPKRRSTAFLFFGVAGVIGAAIVLVLPGREPRHPPVAAPLPLHPNSVRVNFNSDPDGAVIARGDGKTLGLTPLSIEVPYSDSAVEFVFKKSGYETKTVYVVPNLPSPLFATLRKIEVEPVVRPPQPAAVPTPAVHRTRPSREAAAKTEQRVDEDGVLEPSIR